MRRVRIPSAAAVVIAITASAVPLLAGPAGAQTGNLPAFCAARIAANSAESKAENLLAIQKILEVAPAAIVPVVQQLQAGVKKKGNKFFETEAGFQVLAQADAFVYQNCPGTSVPVTAIDYQYQGVPASIPAGVTKFAFTNGAPAETHEMIVFKLTPEGAAMNPEAILSLPQGKAEKLTEPTGQIFLFAPPGQTFYGIGELSAGKYLYACFLPTGGKNTKTAKPHWTQGMYGTFTVS